MVARNAILRCTVVPEAFLHCGAHTERTVQEYVQKLAELLLAAGDDPASPAGVRLAELLREVSILNQCMMICNPKVWRTLHSNSLEESAGEGGAPSQETCYTIMVRRHVLSGAGRGACGALASDEL